MPELAEAELARRHWAQAHGLPVLAVHTHSHVRTYRRQQADELRHLLTGQVLTSSRSHGKRLFFSFGKGQHLELHLGMSGHLFAWSTAQPYHKHDHFALETPKLQLVFRDHRQFGYLILHQAEAPWAHLPPQILSKQFTTHHLQQSMQRKPKRTLKAHLLDQTIFPGIGNWMADEICWVLQAHPAAPLQTISPPELRKVARRICRGALRHIADANEITARAQTNQNSSALAEKRSGFAPGKYVAQTPPKSWLFNHRWKKASPCPRCRTALARTTVANRTTAWCPNCQKPPTPS